MFPSLCPGPVALRTAYMLDGLQPKFTGDALAAIVHWPGLAPSRPRAIGAGGDAEAGCGQRGSQADHRLVQRDSACQGQGDPPQTPASPFIA